MTGQVYNQSLTVVNIIFIKFINFSIIIKFERKK
jgi:hypothetical protein